MQKSEVKVTGLGNFSQIRMSAYFDENESVFYPPFNKVHYEPRADIADDALAVYLVAKKGISITSARYFIEKYIANLRLQAIIADVPLGNMGYFYTERGELSFKPVEKLDVDSGVYGYAPIKVEKIRSVPVHTYSEPEPETIFRLQNWEEERVASIEPVIEQDAEQLPVVEEYVEPSIEEEVEPLPVVEEYLEPSVEEEHEPFPPVEEYVEPTIEEDAEQLPVVEEYIEPGVEEEHEPFPPVEEYVKPGVEEEPEPIPVVEEYVEPGVEEEPEPLPVVEEYVEPNVEEYIEPGVEEEPEPLPVVEEYVEPVVEEKFVPLAEEKTNEYTFSNYEETFSDVRHDEFEDTTSPNYDEGFLDLPDEDNEQRSPLRAIIITLVVIIVLVGGIFALYKYAPDTFKKLQFWKTEKQPVIFQNRPNTIVIPELDSANTDTAKNTLNDSASVAKTDTLARGRFELLVNGGYLTLAEAKTAVTKLRKMGLRNAALSLEVPGNLVKVSAGTFKTLGESEAAKQKLIKEGKLTDKARTQKLSDEL